MKNGRGIWKFIHSFRVIGIKYHCTDINVQACDHKLDDIKNGLKDIKQTYFHIYSFLEVWTLWQSPYVFIYTSITSMNSKIQFLILKQIVALHFARE